MDENEMFVVRCLADALADEIKEAVAKLESTAGAMSGTAEGGDLAVVMDDLTSISVRVRSIGA